MSRGRLFGSKELTRTPIADVMAGVGGKLGGAYAQNVHQSRAQQRADEQRQEDRDFQVDVAWAQSGGESAQEQQRQAELAALKEIYGEDLDAVAAEFEQDLDLRQDAQAISTEQVQPLVDERQGELQGVYDDEIGEIARSIGSQYASGAYDEAAVDADGVVVPGDEISQLDEQLRGRVDTHVSDLESVRPDIIQDQYADEIGDVTREIGEIYGRQDDVGGLLAPLAQRGDRERLDELNEQLERRVDVHDTLQNEFASPEDLDAAIAEAGFGVERLGRREQLREEVPRLDQIGQNVRREGALDAQEKAQQEHRKLLERLDAAGYEGFKNEPVVEHQLGGVDPENSLEEARRALGVIQSYRFNTSQETQLAAAERGDFSAGERAVINYENSKQTFVELKAVEDNIANLIERKGTMENWNTADDQLLAQQLDALQSTRMSRARDLGDQVDNIQLPGGVTWGDITRIATGDETTTLTTDQRQSLVNSAATAADTNRAMAQSTLENRRRMAEVGADRAGFDIDLTPFDYGDNPLSRWVVDASTPTQPQEGGDSDEAGSGGNPLGLSDSQREAVRGVGRDPDNISKSVLDALILRGDVPSE